jgi:hypothetical protein
MALMTIFVFRLKRGLTQTSGKAKGPTHKKAIINADVLKYHLYCGFSFI